MGTWNDLLAAQKKQRINLVAGYAAKSYTMTESAILLGMHKQQLRDFAKKHNIEFAKKSQSVEVVDD